MTGLPRQATIPATIPEPDPAAIPTPAGQQTIERDSEVAAMTIGTAGDLLGELSLPAAPESVPRARNFVRFITIVKGIPHVRDDAEILVSELFTNALRHAADPGTPLLLRLVSTGVRLRIEVHDPSDAMPSAKPVGLMDETGRGWFLIAAIADRHGIEPAPTGKSVWCELSA